jgi:Ca-activated chloride channel family protein
MTIFGAEIAQPYYLFAGLLALPAYWWAWRSSGRVVFSSLRALPGGGATWRTRLAWVPDALLALAIVAFAIALAGPRKGSQPSRIRREGIAIVMAVDVSGSMRALDLGNGDQTRLDAVKNVFQQFVLGAKGLSGRPDDAIGLVAFAHYAETRSPLTLDHANLALAARQLDFARREDDGTAIGAGLELAVQRLVEHKAKSKVVVLLTDGESNVHDIDEDTAIDDAVKAGVKVYTIGAGTNGLADMKVQDEFGEHVVQVPVSIDEAMLHRIADRTGGLYFRATDNASLRSIYRQIDKLERTGIEGAKYTEYKQYYDRFVAAAMILIVLAFALRGTLLRRLP